MATSGSGAGPLDVAGQLGVNPDPFLMAVAIGASCAFLTPIGQTHKSVVNQ